MSFIDELKDFVDRAGTGLIYVGYGIVILKAGDVFLSEKNAKYTRLAGIGTSLYGGYKVLKAVTDENGEEPGGTPGEDGIPLMAVHVKITAHLNYLRQRLYRYIITNITDRKITVPLMLTEVEIFDAGESNEKVNSFYYPAINRAKSITLKAKETKTGDWITWNLPQWGADYAASVIVWDKDPFAFEDDQIIATDYIYPDYGTK